MGDLKRSVDVVEDGGAIQNIEYSNDSGAKKTVEVGAALKYVSATTSAVAIEQGSQLFLFKATTGLGYVTLSDDGIPVVGTAPAADTFPVFGQVYTPIAASDYKFVIGTADIHLYVLKDNSRVRVKA